MRRSKAETLEGPFKGAKAVFFAAAGKTRQAMEDTDEAGVRKVAALIDALENTAIFVLGSPAPSLLHARAASVLTGSKYMNRWQRQLRLLWWRESS